MPIHRVILHIGRHKSGTSALQSYLFKNRQELYKQGILYPESGRIGHGIAHHKFAYACDYKRYSTSKKSRDISQSILGEIRPQHHTLIISSEAFQIVENKRRIKKFLKNFKTADIEIICYFREFADYMMSSFRQATQNQTQYRIFEQFLQHKYDIPKSTKEWSRLGQFRMKWFHPDLLLDGDIIADFCEFTDIPLIENARFHRNISIGGNLLVFKLITNFIDKQVFSYKDLDKLASRRPRFSQPFFVSRERIDWARTKNKYNSFLEKQLGEPPLKYWDSYRRLPDYKYLEEDIEIVQRVLPDVDVTSFQSLIPNSKDWF